MKYLKEYIAECDTDLLLDKAVTIHLMADFTDKTEDDREDIKIGYQHVLDKFKSYGEWTWLRKKYTLVLKKVKDDFNDETYIDVCLGNKLFEGHPAEGLEPWGGAHDKKGGVPEGKYNCNYDGYQEYFASSFTPWRVLANLEVVFHESLTADMDAGSITIEDLLAEFLYDATFHGYEETSYMELKHSLRQQMDDVESGKEELIPMEDLLKDLKDFSEDRSPEEIATDSKMKISFSPKAVEDIKGIISDEMMNDCETD